MKDDINTDERRCARAACAQAVAATLASLPGGRAYAGELEGALTGLGPSARQARRWIAWASDLGLVRRLPKTAAGTVYCLPGDERRMPVDAPPGDFPGPELAGVPPECRRDVALTMLCLIGAGGRATWQELLHAVARRAGRPVPWAAAAVDLAIGTVGKRVIRHEWRASVLDSPHVLAIEADRQALEHWARLPMFPVPADPGGVERWLRGGLGGANFVIAPGEVAIARALARLGGGATMEELRAHVRPDREAGELVAGPWARAEHPPWAVSDGARRIRLASGLWPA